MKEELRTFQKQFVRRALAPGVDVAALSIPRGNGKSWLAAHLLFGDPVSLDEVILARLVAVDNFSRRSYSLDCLRMVCL